MRKFVTLFVLLIFTFSLFRPEQAQAQMPVKARAFLTIVGYGAAGGAILGLASMAFGQSTRTVAQGASLGLYAGIIFGTYVLVSHHNMRHGSYDDSNSPYSNSRGIYGEDYNSDDGGGTEGDSGGGFFERMQITQQKFARKERGGQLPPLYVNIFNYSF
jgi:hypothetical protein